MTTRNKVFSHNNHTFSYREAEVLFCCANGLTAQQTADLLYVCVGTVRRHRENIRAHFDLHGYHALSHFANKLLPELEKCVELHIEMCNSTH